MFKKFFKCSAISGINLAVLVASTFLVFFACSSDSGTKSKEEDKSSGSNYVPPVDKPDPSYNVKGDIVISLIGNEKQYLNINASMEMKPTDPEKAEAGFDYVQVVLNGVSLEKATKPGTIYQYKKEGGSNAKELTTCGKMQVCIEGYYNSEKNNETVCEEVTRDESICRSSSSEVPSSSSAITIKFVPITFENGAKTCSVKRTSGISFAAGQCVATADLYAVCNATSCSDFTTAESNFVMTAVFADDSDGNCSSRYAGGGAATPETSPAQFLPCYEDIDRYEDVTAYSQAAYYLIRPKSGSPDIGNGWYLVYGTNSGSSVSVTAWKVTN